MRKLILGIIILFFLAATAAWAFAGLRVVVFPPANDQPGRIVVATGLSELAPVDSPEAFCMRQGDEDPTCPITFRLAIAREGKTVLELPYNDILGRMVGARENP